MAQTKIGVVYNTSTKEVYSVVIPHDDKDLPLHVSEGHAMIVLPFSEYFQLDEEGINRIVLEASSLINITPNPE